VGFGNILLEGSDVHNNFMYGFKIHIMTYGMVIRYNTIHNHGGMDVICSMDYYNITIQGNQVFDSAEAGMMLNRNMSDSIGRNNDFPEKDK